MVQQGQVPGPDLLIEPVSCHSGPVSGCWRVTWRLQNRGQQPVELLAAWLPHSRFRNEEQAFTPSITLAPGASTQLELPVRCSEPPGTVVENAFLLLRVLWYGQPWRVFARHRVVFDSTGTPQPLAEVVTAHPVGFSAHER